MAHGPFALLLSCRKNTLQNDKDVRLVLFFDVRGMLKVKYNKMKGLCNFVNLMWKRQNILLYCSVYHSRSEMCIPKVLNEVN